MANTTRTLGDIVADLNSIRKGKMPDGSTVASRKKKEKRSPVTLGELDTTEVQHIPDVNLPDEKKGTVVGDLDMYDAKDAKGRTFRVSRQIKGGDPEDPRFQDLDERKRTVGKRSYKAATLGGLTGGQ